MESDVVGELLSATGEGGGDTEIAWRGQNPRRAHCGGQNRADSGSHGTGKESRTEVPSGLLWATGRRGRRWMRSRHAGHAAGNMTGWLIWTSRKFSTAWITP